VIAPLASLQAAPAPLAPAASKIHEPVVDFSAPWRQPDIFYVVVMHDRIADVSESVADE
jgi:hypothetical protein